MYTTFYIDVYTLKLLIVCSYMIQRMIAGKKSIL